MEKCPVPITDFVGLECFDPRKEDFGVQAYIESRGLVPQSIMLGAFWFEELEAFSKVDDTVVAIVPPDVFREEEDLWTRKDLAGLIDNLHKSQCEVYLKISAHPFQLSAVKTMQSFEGGQQRQLWMTRHPELVQTKIDGSTTDLPAINVLKRFASGKFFEDTYISQIIKVLEGYNFDGFCASDGTMGLRGPKETLDVTDYSEDMIDQFCEYTGIQLRGESWQEQAFTLRNEHRKAWSDFYRRRWQTHLQKLQEALATSGRKLVAVDAWSRNPVDMHYDYGLDYRSAKASAPMRVLLQSREANKWRKHREGTYVTEEASILALLSHKIRAPHVAFDWFMTLVNRAEYWHAVKDLPNVVERENYRFTTLSRFEHGSYKPVIDGFTVQGHPTSRSDWDWCTERWTHGLDLQSQTTGAVGLTLVWDESYLDLPTSCPEPYFMERFRTLINAGICVHSVCLIEDIPKVDTQGFLFLGERPSAHECDEQKIVVSLLKDGLVVDGTALDDSTGI